MKNHFKIILLLLIIVQINVSGQDRRSMWLWASSSVVGNTTNENILINECLEESITDLYMYVPSVLYTGNYTNVRNFITKAGCNNIRIWGMDGWRGYFSDLCGPAEFYGYIQDVIDYNDLSAEDEKFFGFHGDNEFHVWASGTGCGSADGFHYGVTDAGLSTSSGGVWYSSEKADRDSLMADFVEQTKTAAEMCHGAGMEYGIAIMPWVSGVSYTHNAIGSQNTPLYAKYGGVTKELYKHLMDYLDEYIVMSYHTNVQGKVVYMLEDELAYADGLSAATRPRVMSSLETHCGVGQYVSYCDTPGEDSKAHVNNEMDAHVTGMNSHNSYSGIAIHDWVGWRDLPSASNNSATPAGASCSVSSTQEELSSLDISVHPIPVSDYLTVGVGVDQDGVATIYSITGTELSVNKIIKGQAVIDMSQLQIGVYVLVVEVSNILSTRKIVKD